MTIGLLVSLLVSLIVWILFGIKNLALAFQCPSYLIFVHLNGYAIACLNGRHKGQTGRWITCFRVWNGILVLTIKCLLCGKIDLLEQNITRLCHFRVYLIVKKKQITRESYGVCCLSFSFNHIMLETILLVQWEQHLIILWLMFMDWL